jgi:hypothetical protein
MDLTVLTPSSGVRGTLPPRSLLVFMSTCCTHNFCSGLKSNSNLLRTIVTEI